MAEETREFPEQGRVGILTLAGDLPKQLAGWTKQRLSLRM